MFFFRNKKKFFLFFYPHTLTFRLKRPVYRGFSGEGKCEGKFLPSHLHSLTFPARSRGDTLPSLRGYRHERYDFFDKEKQKGDFLVYFKRLPDKKNSKWQHVYMHFRTFTQGKCTNRST